MAIVWRLEGAVTILGPYENFMLLVFTLGDVD